MIEMPADLAALKASGVHANVSRPSECWCWDQYATEPETFDCTQPITVELTMNEVDPELIKIMTGETESLLDLPEISAVRGGSVAAGGWCAPIQSFFDLAKPPTKNQTIKSLRERNARQAKMIAKQQKQIKKLKKAIIEGVLRGN